MKIYNKQDMSNLCPQLVEVLGNFRQTRCFDVDDYIEIKTNTLNTYMKDAGLKACVVAVSGGVDSAAVLGIIHAASLLPNSSIKKITALLMPIFDSTATTNQIEALSRGKAMCDCYSIPAVVIDLSKAHEILKKAVDSGAEVVGESWASGQLVSYIRTPAIYYATSLLSQQGLPAIVCGTTNRDEGGYLGFFGKASDGMVDVQLISDLHKSEIYAVGKKLKVPKTILLATPTGDMYDGRIDEEVFGTSYDFVEIYLSYLNLSDNLKKTFRGSLGKEATQQFDYLAERLEKLHSYNAHKYLANSPAVHLDVIKSGVPGGWNYD